MRRTALPFLVGLALLAPALSGCLGFDPVESSPAGDGVPEPGPGAADRVLANASTNWSASVGDETRFSLDVTVRERAGAVFPEIRYDLSSPGAELQVDAVAPDGETYPVARASGSTDDVAWDHALLPAVPGEWTLEGVASGNAEGRLEARTVAPGPDLEPVEPGGDGRVVVAVVDTGVNPYHQAFEAPGLGTGDLPARIQEAADGERRDPLSVPLREADTYRESLLQDAGTWTRLPGQRLVHFQDTRVLGYNLAAGEPPGVPVLDAGGHGTMTTHAVLAQNPDALVVMVTGGDYDEGVRWANDQPWIDLLSLSWGPVVNAAGVAEPHAFDFTTAEATQESWNAGKLVFSATGNDPTLAHTDTTSGPPWVHAVSGSQPDTRGRALASGNGVDTVANWTQTLAHHRSLDGNATASGTSFATPLTAGVASRILAEARAAAGHEGGIRDGAFVDAGDARITNGDLREALNRTAVYWDTTDYEGPTDPGPSVPVAPAAPWISMGWGHVDGRVVEPALEGLLGDEPLPEKPDEAVAYMEANHDARAAYWEAR